MLGWFLSLFGLRRKVEAQPIREEDAYARSYGDRGGDILHVERLPDPEPQQIPRRTGDMTGELLRRAFESKLDSRGKSSTAA
ncbi:MAG: hypothetical protein ACRDLM_09180 [Gaiellaceae bacterium]